MGTPYLPPMIPGLNALYRGYLYPEGSPPVSFTEPAGEPALVPADSVSWRVFSNPVPLFVGGVLAVILELALPGVRHGVWDHSTFRTEPRLRLQRTGLAAMVTVYGARSVALEMIGHINELHAKVRGVTDGGEPYAATDERLLVWVQATAVFGFAAAYDALVRPLSEAERDAVFAEGLPAARAYGALGAPTDQGGWAALLEETLPRLEPSDTLRTFLDIMAEEPVLPLIAKPLQAPLVRLAAGLVPAEVAERLSLGERWRPRAGDRLIARGAAAAAGRIVLPANPAVQACRRLGLPGDMLYARRGAADMLRAREGSAS